MTIIPAIDIKGGRCVRLFQGRFDRETVYCDDPVEVAKRWEEAGAEWIHIVDLDGAREGRPVNEGLVKRILEAVRSKVQLGGGIRTLEAIRRWLELGVGRVVLGTRAVEDPEFLKKAVELFGQKVVLAIDAKEGVVMSKGWTAQGGLTALDLALKGKQLGVQWVLYTDISRDGTTKGPDLEGAKGIAALGLKVILSGGVGSMEDLERAKEVKGIEGVIVGRALYEGMIDLAEALRRFR